MEHGILGVSLQRFSGLLLSVAGKSQYEKEGHNLGYYV